MCTYSCRDRRGSLALTAAIGLVLFAPRFAAAEDTPQIGNDSLMSDIVVTARKRDESAQSVPVSINAFSEEQLRSVGVAATKDIVKITPGLQWKGDSPFGGNNIFLRGVGANSTEFTSSPAVGVYLDETYLSTQAYHGFATFDMERVEVLKGPQGTLYGRNTTGGAIKYVTRKPKVGEGFNGDLKLDVGNFGLVKAEGGLGADVGENVAVRLGFLSWDRGGIYHDYVQDVNSTDINVKAFRFQVAAKPTDRLSIDVGASYGRSRSDDIRYKRVDTVDPATIDPSGAFFTGRCANPHVGTAPGCTSFLQFFGATDDLNTDAFEVQSDLTRKQVLERITTWGFTGVVNYDFDFATLTSATSYFKLKLAGPQDVDGTAANIITINDRVRDHQISQEFRLTSNGDGALKWVVGAYYFRDVMHMRKPVNIAPLGFGFGEATDQVTDAFSLFAEGTYSITDRFDVTVGGRWSHDKLKDDFTYYNYFNDGVSQLVSYDEIVRDNAFLPGTFTLNDQKKSWSNLSGRLVLSYKIQPDVMVYASFNRGYKAGEFNVGANSPQTAIFVDPEKLNAFEAGLKSELLDQKLRLNVAGFYYDYKDKQETLFDTGVAILSNADARVKGVEVDFTAQPVQQLTLSAGYSYLDAKYKHFPSCHPDGSNCDGNRLTSAPKGQLNALARYEFDVNGHELAVQGGVQHSSKRYFDFRNVSYIADKSYWLFDARVSFEVSEAMSVSAWVENIGNTRYFADGYDVSVFGYSLLAPGMPRAYGGSFTYRFGGER
ncbi:MAG: TonB-dependent receptor [Steroidobacteraceae bacterium]